LFRVWWWWSRVLLRCLSSSRHGDVDFVRWVAKEGVDCRMGLIVVKVKRKWERCCWSVCVKDGISLI
jgi:hypothetical protein